MTYPDGSRAQVHSTPPATLEQVLETRPGATAEPVIIAKPSAPTDLSAHDERAIRAWLAIIGETDPVIIDGVLTKCQQNAEARHYFTGRAGHRTKEASDNLRRKESPGATVPMQIIVARK